MIMEPLVMAVFFMLVSLRQAKTDKREHQFKTRKDIFRQTFTKSV